MQYIIVNKNKKYEKVFYKNKIHLFFIKLYCYFKHYEIL